MLLEFDCPETLYAVHKLTEAERRQGWTNGIPTLYALLDRHVLARVEAVGFSATWHAHRIVRVTGGAVDVDAHWRRARHATRDRMRLLFAKEESWHAERRKRIAEEEAERRREAQLREEAEERAQFEEEIKDVVFEL